MATNPNLTLSRMLRDHEPVDECPETCVRHGAACIPGERTCERCEAEADAAVDAAEYASGQRQNDYGRDG